MTPLQHRRAPLRTSSVGHRRSHSTRARTWLFLLLVALLTPTSFVFAEESEALAELLFQKGRDAMERQDYETACESFEESLRLDPAVGTLMNLAVCQGEVGRLATAWELWQRVLRRLPEDDRRRDFAEERAAALEGDLSRLVVTLDSAAPQDARILRDGVELAPVTWGEAIPVDSGESLIRVEHPGFEPTEQRVEVGVGATARIVVTVGEPVAAAPEEGASAEDATSARQRRRKIQRIAAVSSAGVAVGGFALAGITAALLPGAEQSVEDGCDASTRLCDEDGAQAAKRGRTLLALNTAGWIVGAVASSAAIVLWTTAPKRSSEETAAKKRNVARVVLRPGPGLSLEGSF